MVVLCFHDVGVQPVAHISLNRLWMACFPAVGSALRISLATPSGPGLLLLARLLMVSWNVCSSSIICARLRVVGGGLSSSKQSIALPVAKGKGSGVCVVCVVEVLVCLLSAMVRLEIYL